MLAPALTTAPMPALPTAPMPALTTATKLALTTAPIPALATALAPALPMAPAAAPAPAGPAALVHAGQILSTQLPVHSDLVAESPDETLQVVEAQSNPLQAPALLCSGCTTTRDARAARNLNPEPSR